MRRRVLARLFIQYAAPRIDIITYVLTRAPAQPVGGGSTTALWKMVEGTVLPVASIIWGSDTSHRSHMRIKDGQIEPGVLHRWTVRSSKPIRTAISL